MRYEQKKKLKQKIFAVIALVIALIMVLSLAAPIFAMPTGTATSTMVEVSEEKEETVSTIPIEKEVGTDRFTLDVNVGFDGSYVVQQITPVRGTITNLGEDFTGELQIKAYTYEDNELNYSKYAIYAQPITLAKGTTKQISMDIGMSTIRRSLQISLVDAQGNVVFLKNEPVEAVSPDAIVFGVLTEQPTQLQYISQIEMLYTEENMNQAFFLNADTFPDSEGVLANFHAIVIDDFDTTTLRPEQIDVLRSWVDGGGLLILGTGAHAQKVLSGLDFLPVQIGGSTKLSQVEDITGKTLSFSSPLQVTDLQAEKIQTVWKSGQTALTSKLEYGGGTVLLHHFALGLAPFSALPERADVLETLYLQTVANAFSSRVYFDFYQMRYSADHFPALSSGQIWLIFGAVLVYILIVGPVLYLVLKKKDRREWGWVVIPALSIVFMAVMFLLTRQSVYQSSLLNTAAIVNCEQGSTQAKASVAFAMKSPHQGDVTFRSENNIPIQPIIDRGWYGNYTNISELEYKVATGENTEVTFYDNMAWASNVLYASKVMDLGGTIESSVHLEDEKIQGELNNQSNVAFDDVLLDVGGIVVRIGALGAGETKTIDIPVTEAMLEQGYESYQLFFDGSSPLGSVQKGQMSREEAYRLSREADLFEQVYYNSDFSGSWDSTKVVCGFYGFSTTPIFDGFKYINGKVVQESSMAMYCINFEQDLSKMESFDLQQGLQPDWENMDVNQNISVNYDQWARRVWLYNMSSVEQVAEMAYTIGEDVRIDEMTFGCNYLDRQTAQPEIYHVTTDTWEILKEEPYTNAMEYIDENHQIRIKVSVQNETGAPVLYVKGGGLNA